LVRCAHLEKGETLLVNGGAGGVGSTVVQMAKALGARVLATAGSEEKVAACRELGAEVAMNYKTQNVAEALKKAAPDGVNVWWETAREPDFDLAIGSLARRGRMVVMAGREARPKDCSLHGFVMFMATHEEQRACAGDINRWLAEGRLQPKIDRVLPLSETAAAHRLQEESTLGKSGALAGKIVVRP